MIASIEVFYMFEFKTFQVSRADPTDNPLSNPEAMSQTAVPMKPFRETHGGEDVALYAAGQFI